MDIIIQSLGFTAGDTLENFIREKVGKFDREAKIIRANVVLFIGSDSNPNKYYCEIRLEVPGKDHFVKESSPEFEQSVDSAVNKLQGMIRKAKEKQVDQWQGKVNGES